VEGDEITMNLLPSIDCTNLLLAQKQKNPKSLLRKVLYPYLPRKLVIELQNMWWPNKKELPIAEISELLLRDLSDKIQNWKLKPSTDEISSKTMESQREKDLYFIGEVLDVTGHLGGFNFQWAWASGYVAGEVV
jgi:predicted flavoprotein YhiN